jgi:nucleoside recognition membrane protein YjiH
MTGFQYERGFYTARESAVIATNFSVVSIPFVVLIAQVSGLREYFFHLYSSMIFVCVICAFITPKLPPLSRIKDEYYGPVGKQFKDDVLDESSNFDRAISHALKTANRADNPLKSLKKGFNTMLDIFFMMMPAAMTIEFLTLAIFHHTSFFQILSYPLIPVLNVLQIPEVAGTAPGVIIGLLDQFVPAILAGTLNEPIAKFILAGLSVTQLIFFAETAILIMRSAIPISVLQLIAIFFIRTIIALPLLTLIAHSIF